MHQKLFFSFMICAAVLFPNRIWAQEVENIELQWSLCESSVESFRTKTQAAIGQGSPRDLYYAETRTMDLNALSSLVRLRVTNKKIKTTVKLNYPTDQNLPWDSLAGQDGKCEWDRYDQHLKVGCSLNAKRSELTDFLSHEQKEYLSQERGFSAFSALILLGPVKNIEWNWPSDFLVDTEMTLQTVSGPENIKMMELSARVPLRDSGAAFQRIQDWLQQHQVVLCPSQAGISTPLIRALLRQKFPE